MKPPLTRTITSRQERVIKNMAFLEIFVCIGTLILIVTMLYIIKDHRNIHALYMNPVLKPTIFRTLWVCIPTSFTVVALGYAIAFFCHVYIPKHASKVLFVTLMFYVVSYYFILLGWRALWGENGLLEHIPVLGTINSKLSYGYPAMITVMTLRYLPIGILLIYLRVRSLPVSKIYAAKNLGLTAKDIHFRLYLLWSRPVLGLVSLFTIVFSSLDYLASSLAGGGRIQILANLINDWQRSHQYQDIAMSLGLFYVILVSVLLYCTFCLFSTSGNNRATIPQHKECIKHKGLEFWILLVITVIVILMDASIMFAVFFMAVGFNNEAFPSCNGLKILFTDKELLKTIFFSIKVSGTTAAIGTIIALISVVARHIRHSTKAVTKKQFEGASNTILLIPLVVPPLLSGITIGTFQGMFLGYYGSEYSIISIHVITYAPLAYFIIANGLNELSENSYLAARNLGIGLGKYIFFIFMRACRLTIPISILLIFAFSINDSILARYVGGIAQTLGIFVADKQIATLDAEHFSVVALMFIFTVIAMLLLWFVIYKMRRTKKI